MQVIYVMRNPKDVFTSSFHYYGMTSFMTQPGLQSEFLQKFLDGTGCWPWLMHSVYLIKGGEWCSHLMINSYFNAKLDVFTIFWIVLTEKDYPRHPSMFWNCVPIVWIHPDNLLREKSLRHVNNPKAAFFKLPTNTWASEPKTKDYGLPSSRWNPSCLLLAVALKQLEQGILW